METMQQVTYTVELDREEDGRWIADVVSIPGCMAYGATRQEAIENVRKLAEEVIADMRSHGETLPEDLEVDRITLQMA